jgi:DNA helicase-2/ATP-dependent DNA helicase PcrA
MATSLDISELAKKERSAIVQHRFGPAIVIAGPGSGKTTTLAERFVSLCQEAMADTSRIVGITFTNHAAGQMKKEVKKKCKELDDSKIRIGTLHSLAKGLLHKYSKNLNLPSNFRVVTGRDQEAILLTDMRLELKAQKLRLWPHGRKYLSRFQATKASVPDIDTVATLPNRKEFPSQAQFNESYDSLLRYYKSIDWFDVVSLAVKLLKENKDILSVVAGKFDHLLVDEYQDLNRADHEFIRLLATKTKSVMVFGDDDQSIYQTRRFANPRGIKDFENVYTKVKNYPLSVCWRCGSLILDAAWKLININSKRMPERKSKKKPIPNPKCGYGAFELLPQISEKAEIKTIFTELQKEINYNNTIKDILVLFHSKKIGRKYADEVQKKGINVKNLLGQPDKKSESVLLLYEMLRLLKDDSDNFASRFLLEKFFKQEVPWIAKRRLHSQNQNISLWQSALTDTNTPQIILAWPEKLEKWRQMKNVAEMLIDLSSSMEIKEEPEIKTIIDWSNRQKSLTILEILDRLERRSDFEELVPEGTSEKTDEICSIKFMTMHGAKGLNADIVFVPALEDELMPNKWYEPEQRRLLYVSMTRAKCHLLLSWAWSRKGRDTHRSPKSAPIKRNRSRFLDDIERPKMIAHGERVLT